MAYLVLMFIGGSPGGTAGGVKTVTVAVLLASMLANIRGRADVSMLHRRVSDETVRRCVAIIAFSFTVLLALTTALLAVVTVHHHIKLVKVGGSAAHPGLNLLLAQPHPEDSPIGQIGCPGKLFKKEAALPQLYLSNISGLGKFPLQQLFRQLSPGNFRFQSHFKPPSQHSTSL